MNAKTDDVVIDQLNRMDRMNIAAARGVRNESELDREQWTVDGVDVEVTIIIAEPGFVTLVERPDGDDMAWASHAADLKIIDDLIETGDLVGAA